jgi:two-component system chemotaxis sensor kinase CheA
MPAGQSVADVCHVMETRLDEEGEPPEAQEIAELAAAWSRLKVRLHQVLDESAGRRIEVEPAVFDDGLSTADTVTEISGRGVGLGVVEASCRAHGGRVRVLSQAGAGTVFEFRFPRQEIAASPLDLLSPAVQAPASVRPTA